MIDILKTVQRTAWRLFAIGWLSIGGLATAAYAQKTVQLKAVSAPEIRIVIPDVRMCPGEEYDIPVYIETTEPIDVYDFTLGFRFPDYVIVEPSGGGLVTNLHEDLRTLGSSASNYSEKSFANLPDRTFAFNWYSNYAYGGGRNTITLTSGQLLFRFRVKYKQEADGAIDLVGGTAYPDAYDYSHFVVRDAGTLFPTFEKAYVRPSAPPEVWAFSDTTVCVLSETRLWAEGGVQFYWEDISQVLSTYRPAIAEPRVQYPVFRPQDPGLYTYRVKITSKTGCSAYDTVNYLVLDNGLNLIMPKDTIVDLNGEAVLNATVYGGYPPYNLSWQPAALVVNPQMAGLAPARSGGRVEVENLSRPLQKPQWFTVRAQDRYCALEKRQSVNVVGSDMEAVITMNPQYVCATQKLNAAITLKVDVRGGMGRYKYAWSAENLEEGQKAPEFETDSDGPTVRVRIYARCVVHVDISDEITRKITRFTDTVRILDQTPASVTIQDLNGSVCEMSEMTFTALAVNGGDNPHYSWRIDGAEVFAGSDPVFKTYLLRAGSTVSCVLTSDKACVSAKTATATITPNVVTPGYMAVRPTLGSDAENTACRDSLSLGLVHRHTGSRFRLRWFRNDNELVYDQYVTYDSPVETAEKTVLCKLPRGGYYDYYRASVTESDRACLLWDSVITDRIYPRLMSSEPVSIGPAATKTASDTMGVCSATTVAVYARGVQNLPDQFRLVWYKKSPGAAAEAVGYYASGSQFTGNSAYGRNLGTLYSSVFTSSGDAYITAWEWAQKEFPLYVRVGATSSAGNDTPVAAGDSLYYRLETAAHCSAKAATLTSSRFVVKVMPSIATTVSEITHLQPYSSLCEGSVARFAVDVRNYAGGQCHWYYNGQDVQDVYPDWLTQSEGAMQDTLTVAHYHKGDTIGFRFYSSYKCVSGNRWTPMQRTWIPEQNISKGVYPFLSPDTMVCAGADLQLKAKGSYSGNHFRGVNYTIHWADSRAALEAGQYLSTDSILNVVVDSARFGDRSADLYKDSAVVGVIPYYAYITSDLGCEAVDSVLVTVAYRRQPTVRVVPVPDFPWCEGNLGNAYFKLEGEFWGQTPKFAIWATRTYRTGTFSDWEIANKSVWPYSPDMFKEGYPVAGSALSSMLTCVPQDVYSDSIHLEFREHPELWVSDEKPMVCQGDELTVTGYGCTKGEYVRLHAMGYSEDEMMEALDDAYIFAWYDAAGNEVSESRVLKVTPAESTTYTLLAQDKEGRCAVASKKIDVTVALKTGIDITFTDAATGKEVPFSMCAGSDSVTLMYELTPRTPIGKKAYYGFVVVDMETDGEKDFWTQKPGDKFPVKFYPGERLVYYCVHDTLSCWGGDYDMDSVDIQMSRAEALTFVAGPDTMLCETGGAYLYIGGAMGSSAALPEGAPSLKKYLQTQGVAGASNLPDNTMVYWWPQAGMTDADKTSLMPFVSPQDHELYYVWAYNDYGCIQSDSVRVERFDGGDIDFKLVLTASDSLLCDSDVLSFSLDRAESSILTLFDSLVWRRAQPAPATHSNLPSAPSTAEILAVNTDKLEATVSHGDTVYVEGFVKGDGLCEAVDAAWYVSNKIVVKSYRRPSMVLSQAESAACADSLLDMHASTDEGAVLYWVFGPKAGGGVGTETPQYKILDGGRPRPDTAWCRLLTRDDFTAVAEAYFHPACVGVDSIQVQVKKQIDTLRIRLDDVPSICGTAPVEIKISQVENADSWRWWVNGRPLMASDLADESGTGIAVLGDRMECVIGQFTDGDLVWVEAQTAERCAYKGAALSDTVRIRRSESPIWRWLAMDSTDASGVQMTMGCVEEPLSLRLLVERGGGLRAEEWRSDGTHGERRFTHLETTSEGQLYGLETAYLPSETWLYIGLGYENCSVEDSIRIIGLPHEQVEVTIEAAELSVCAGMEVDFGLIYRSNVDSVVWYVNDRPVLAGEPFRAAVAYTYRPEPGDSVYVEAYNRYGRCVAGNGIRSNVVRVEVLSEDHAAPLEAVLSAEADSVCGAGALTYTVSGSGFDSVYWYANGQLAAVTDVLSGAKTLAETRTATWKRVPRDAAEGLDSLYAVAVRRDRVCGLYDSLRTDNVSVYRRAKPIVVITPRDTTVPVGDAIRMRATGASSYLWWTDFEDDLFDGATFTLLMPTDTVTVYTMGYEPAYGPDSLAGGLHAAPAMDAYGDFGCRAYDSVRVLPGETFEEVQIFVPNAVLPNSAHPADRVFKVFGEDVTSVHMQIYNSGGDLVFEKRGANPVWKPEDAATGNYVYRLSVTLKSGEIIKKNGWISVIE